MFNFDDVELNEDQKYAAMAIYLWFSEISNIQQTFVLSGYAGTGKTFLVNYVIKKLLDLGENEVTFVAPTGKAASVISQRGNPATTIHRLIYHTEKVEQSIALDNGDVITKTTYNFIKKSSLGPELKLIVLDEISMVESKIMDDLLSFGIPILCCGDQAQLPAIYKSNNLLSKPDATLTEIVRQSAENNIVKLAEKARKGIPFLPGKYGAEVLVLDKNFISEEQMKKLLLNADQILCGKNSTRIKINNMVRKLKGIDPNTEKYPRDGEKVICNRNSWEVFLDSNEEYNLVNGTTGYVSNFETIPGSVNLAKMSFQADFLNESVDGLLVDSKMFSENTNEYEHDLAYELTDGTFWVPSRSKSDQAKLEKLKKLLHAVKVQEVEMFDYGYCISVHKSQGSEWNNVVLFDESHVFGKDAARHLYTGITRAKKRLVIIR